MIISSNQYSMNNIRTVILFAAMSASLWSCGTGIVRHDDDPTPSVNSLVLRASTTVIEADGNDAVQLEVLADGVPVTEGVRLYDGVTNLAIELPSMTFTTTEPGTYYFWAAYGTAHSEQLKVTAVGFDLPSLPEDPEPDNTSFVRRVLLTQFTGTRRGLCLQGRAHGSTYLQQHRSRISFAEARPGYGRVGIPDGGCRHGVFLQLS